MYKLLLIASIALLGSPIYAGGEDGTTVIDSPSCDQEAGEGVTCKTTCKKKEPEVKIVYRDKIVEKIVYRDRPKIIYVDKPINTKVVEFKDREVKVEVPTPTEKDQLTVHFIMGYGSSGLYTELDEETSEYQMYQNDGVIGGAMGTYNFGKLVLGFGALSNKSYFGSIGAKVN